MDAGLGLDYGTAFTILLVCDICIWEIGFMYEYWWTSDITRILGNALWLLNMLPKRFGTALHVQTASG